LPALVAEPPPRTFPPLEGPARTFGFDRDAGFRVGDHTRTSRFILYDNGAFELQYDGLASYRGRYTLSDATVVFEFQANPASGGVAMGTLQDGELVVRYNLNMRLSDFDDAVYVLRP
jgi:hypothetical protein